MLLFLNKKLIRTINLFPLHKIPIRFLLQNILARTHKGNTTQQFQYSDFSFDFFGKTFFQKSHSIKVRQGIGRTGRSLGFELLSDRSRRLFGVVVAAAVLFHPRTTRTGRRTRFRRSPAAPKSALALRFTACRGRTASSTCPLRPATPTWQNWRKRAAKMTCDAASLHNAYRRGCSPNCSAARVSYRPLTTLPRGSICLPRPCSDD